MPDALPGECCDAETVLRFPCFHGLDRADAAAAASRMRLAAFSAGDVVFHQGGRGDSVYLLAAGTLEIRLSLADGAPHALATLERGAILGEISLLLDEPRTATAVAKTDAACAVLDREQFHASLAKGEAWAGRLLLAASQTLARRLANANVELGALIAAAKNRAEKSVPPELADDLESFRTRLFSEWSF